MVVEWKKRYNCIGKRLKNVFDTRTDIAAFKSRRSVYFTMRPIDSPSEAWSEILECFKVKSKRGQVSVKVVRERSGVFKDCSACDNLLQRTLWDIIEPPRWENDLMCLAPRQCFMPRDRLMFMHELLSSPPRPKCGEASCCVSKPVRSGEYVATMTLRFREAVILVDYYSIWR